MSCPQERLVGDVRLVCTFSGSHDGACDWWPAAGQGEVRSPFGPVTHGQHPLHALFEKPKKKKKGKKKKKKAKADRQPTPADQAAPWTVDDDQQLVCRTCGARSGTRVGMVAHLRSHADRVDCPNGCGRKLNSGGGLNKHLNTCPGPPQPKEPKPPRRSPQLHPPPAGHAMLTPMQVATMFEVTPKQVKVWANAGEVEFETTSGGHRRYPAQQFIGYEAPTVRVPDQVGPTPRSDSVSERQVAAMFGVDVAQVVAWADAGLLDFERSPQGRRRFPASQFAPPPPADERAPKPKPRPKPVEAPPQDVQIVVPPVEDVPAAVERVKEALEAPPRPRHLEAVVECIWSDEAGPCGAVKRPGERGWRRVRPADGPAGQLCPDHAYTDDELIRQRSHR